MKMVDGKVLAFTAEEVALQEARANDPALAAKNELRSQQKQAAQEQATIERDAIKYFVRGEAFPTELKDYHAALGDVLTAVGDAVALPVKPVITSKPA